MNWIRYTVLLVALLICCEGFSQQVIWVAPNGSNVSDGSKESPFGSIAVALRKARELRRLDSTSSLKDVVINVREGVYSLYEPIFVRPEDSGTPGHPLIIQAAPGETPIVSGGVNVTGWNKVKGKVDGLPAVAQGKVWAADMPKVGGRNIEFRQLWVNGKKAVRCREVNDNNLKRILSVDKQNEEIWVEVPSFKLSKDVGQMEIVLHEMWATAILRIKSLDVVDNKARLTFYQPESRIHFEHPWPSAVVDGKNGNSAYYFTNGIQLLDEPGEWYLDMNHGKVYYWPKADEDMTAANVVAPVLEQLIKVEGSPDRPVSNIIIKDISFQHTTWLRPSLQGHVPLQEGMYLLDAYKLKPKGTIEKKGLDNQGWIGRPAAGIEISGANDIQFQHCDFRHMASAGLDLVSGTNHNLVQGCVFRDIGGNAVQVGAFSPENFETHLPYDPADQREISSYDRIENNYIDDVTNEDWGCVGIAAGCVRNINIEHNEICNVAYTGISVGWGWTKSLNCMRNNRIHANYIHHYANHMYDVAGIYTLSAQPGTTITENCVDSIGYSPYVHDPEHWFYLYLDEGSSYMTVKNNWCPKEKFLANANGPGNTWENNGPMVADSIKNAAGLLPGFKTIKHK
jgi:hypothetical protein